MVTGRNQEMEADPTLKGQDLPTGDESNSITLKEHKKALEDAIAQYGDRIKKEKIDPIAKERDDFKSQVSQFKSQVEEATSTLKETEARITDLEADLETATEGDTDLAEVQKIKKELRAEKEKARQEARTEKEANAELKKTLEAEREEWAETVADAQAAKFEVDVFEIAEEYVDDAGKDIKSERLKALCEKAGQKKREDIQALADVLWTKKGKIPVLVGDSGVSSGGKGEVTEEQRLKGRYPSMFK